MTCTEISTADETQLTSLDQCSRQFEANNIQNRYATPPPPQYHLLGRGGEAAAVRARHWRIPSKGSSRHH